jgi:hypothetical protein
MDNKSAVTWDDIAGLEFAKSTIQVIDCIHIVFRQNA